MRDFGPALDRYITGNYGEDQFRRPGVSMRDEALRAMDEATLGFVQMTSGRPNEVALDGLLDWLEHHEDTLALEWGALSILELVDLLREQRDE